MKENNLKAPFILTCCGSLTRATIRFASHTPADGDNKVAEKLETRLMDDIKEDLMMGIMMDDMDSSSPSVKYQVIPVLTFFLLIIL